MADRPQPAPGSDAAVAQGCTCPVMDNAHGRGIPTKEGEQPAFWITRDCSLHGNTRMPPPLPADLVARLEAMGGLATGEQSRWGGWRIITPLGAHHKEMWVSAGALESLLEEWQGTTAGQRLSVWLFGPHLREG